MDPRPLLREAAAAAAAAHCPYSQFRVGAALRARDGRVFRGCNVENASYGLTLCAERVAFSTAVAQGCRDFTAMAIVADGAAHPYPCGACRQVMAEFCRSGLAVYVAPLSRLDDFEELQLDRLLPNAFTLPPSPGRKAP